MAGTQDSWLTRIKAEERKPPESTYVGVKQLPCPNVFVSLIRHALDICQAFQIRRLKDVFF